MEEQKRLGKRVSKLRKRCGFSQEELSERAGISVKHLSSIERGQENPTFELLVGLAKGLNVGLPQLLDLGSPPTKKSSTLIIGDVIDPSKEEAALLVDDGFDSLLSLIISYLKEQAGSHKHASELPSQITYEEWSHEKERDKLLKLALWEWLASGLEKRGEQGALSSLGDKEFLTLFGARVRRCRQERDWTQAKLAKKTNRHQTYIAGVERGERNVTLLIVKVLAEALEVPVDALFTWTVE